MHGYVGRLSPDSSKYGPEYIVHLLSRNGRDEAEEEFWHRVLNNNVHVIQVNWHESTSQQKLRHDLSAVKGLLWIGHMVSRHVLLCLTGIPPKFWIESSSPRVSSQTRACLDRLRGTVADWR